MESSFLKKIEEQDREIRRDREDVQRLLRRYPGYDFVLTGTAADKAPTTNGEDRNPRALSALEQAILALMDATPQNQWTSRTMVTAFRMAGEEAGYRLSDNDDAAMNAVGLALGSLKEAGKIRRSHEGRGRDPHRYVSLAQIEQEATPEEIAS